MASQPSPASPSVSSGMPTWVKVLLVLVVIVMLGVLAVVGAGYYFVRKITSEPGGPLAAITRLANPDYEVLDVNDKDKTITVRHKKTGKQATLPLDSVRNGAINPKDVGLTNDEAGVKEPPAWATYPGATVETTAGSGRGTQLTLKTGDAADKVYEYYEGQMKANGYDVTSVSLTKTLMGKSKSGGSLTVQVISGKSDETAILVVLQDN